MLWDSQRYILNMFFFGVLFISAIVPCFSFPCSTREDEYDVKRAAVSNTWKWPATTDASGKVTVLIPYTTKNLDSLTLELLEKVKATLKKKTCIQLVPRTTQAAYVEIYKGVGCSATIGYRKGKKTPFSLGTNCEHYDIIMHESLHILGFYHEQARPDRNNYVQILEENIQDGKRDQFDIKYGARTFGLPYDYKSIMHYKKEYFSKNGKPTILAKEDPSMTLGGEILSAGDVSRINTFYNCPQKDIVQANYEIKVFTMDKMFAGTNAKVYIDLYENGKKNTGELYLEGGSFERGDVDTFKKTLPYMRTLSKIDIRHDNTGWYAGWDLQKVEVKIDHGGTNKRYTFNCNCELEGSSNTKTLTSTK